MKQLGIIALVLGSATAAHAQTATPLDCFEPAPAGDTFAFVPSPDVAGGLRPAATLALSFANSPLVLVDTTNADRKVEDVVGHQLALHGLVAFELFHRLKLDLDVPVTLSQDGASPVGGGITSASPSGAAMNDVRVGMRVQLLQQERYWPSVGVSLTGWFPSGDSDAYTSSGHVRLAPAMMIGADYDVFVWSTTVSRRFDTSDDVNLLGNELLFGVAAGPRFGPVLLSAEVWGSTVSQRGTEAFSLATTNAEAHLAVRYDLGPFSFRVAGGPGLTAGAGTPDYRLVGMIGYAPEVPNAWRRQQQNDRMDAVLQDGTSPGPKPGASAPVPGAVPAPGVPTAKPGAAPGVVGAGPVAAADDRDEDGVLDAADACPDVPGPAAGPKPGCPPDKDGDGVIDRDDACPDVAGVRSSDVAKDGCPGDSDGDGIADPDDACPKQAGDKNEDPKKNGCVESVRVVGEQIVILEKVEFETGRAKIQAASEKLLEQVAKVINGEPQIVRVSIEGHTDNVGSEKANILLSQERAMAVMRWLIDHGVDERRLEARGYGPRQPLAKNDTPAGRAKNRRVDFQIIKRSAKGKAAWTDGAVD